MRAVLYARVSTAEQAEKGYSLRQQSERLRNWCAESGHEVVEVVEERGVSGTILERPGLARVLELVAGGEANLVVAQDMDRVSREPWHFGYLKAKLDERGATLRTLDDNGDDSAEAEFFRDIRRGMAKMERGLTARRTKRGRERRAREGRVVGAASAPYGFVFNEDRTMLLVDEERAPIVRRIFRLLGEQGLGLITVKKLLDREGEPSPQGKRFWNATIIKDMVRSDTYRPHTNEELRAMVEDGRLASEVFARLDPGALYGVWWYGREKVTRTGKLTPSGKPARKLTARPPEEWIAVPVPNAGVPLACIEAARAGIEGNVRPPSAGYRFWELSGGMLRCPCGSALTHMQNSNGKTRKFQFFYVCSYRRRHGAGACEHAKFHGAEKLERRVREFVQRLVRNPDTLREQVIARLRLQEASVGPVEEEVAHLHSERRKVAEERDGYIRLAARGAITDFDLDRHLTDTDRRDAELREALEGLSGRRERARENRRYLDLLDEYLADFSDLLEIGDDTGENGPAYREVYDMLGLSILAHRDRTLELTWTAGGAGRKLRPEEPEPLSDPPPPDDPCWEVREGRSQVAGDLSPSSDSQR